MSDQQFETNPGALKALAGDFHHEATSLPGDAISFGRAAGQIGEAFGVLGVCDGASSQYASLLTSTLNALGKVAEMLEGDAEQLGQTAQTYVENEEQVRQQFSRVHQSF
ncbi:WXG100 family type VII secretion target [Streptacidiphilus melanogenes]|uniref:WXG100 family type VII secretion target n=1 Tax=Streptacidiphilus melanogenes TaxID=411235 RepID=UPI0005A61A27|nr:hypothetical protein [Streptacidiphilus melanogenes]